MQYAASHRLGLAVSYDPVDQMARVTEKYYAWVRGRLATHARPDRLPRQYLARRDGPRQKIGWRRSRPAVWGNRAWTCALP